MSDELALLDAATRYVELLALPDGDGLYQREDAVPAWRVRERLNLEESSPMIWDVGNARLFARSNFKMTLLVRLVHVVVRSCVAPRAASLINAHPSAKSGNWKLFIENGDLAA